MKLNLAIVIFFLGLFCLKALGQKKASTKIPEFCSINSTLLSNGKFQVKIRWKPATDSSIIGYLLVNEIRMFKPDSLLIIGRNLPEQTILISKDDYVTHRCGGVKIFSIDSLQNKFSDNLKWTPIIIIRERVTGTHMSFAIFSPIMHNESREYFYRYSKNEGKSFDYFNYWTIKACGEQGQAFFPEDLGQLPSGLYQIGTICNNCDSSYFTGYSWNNIQTSLTETNVSYNFQVFPNPVSNKLFVSIGENLKGKELSFELLLPNGQVADTFQIDDTHSFYDFEFKKIG